MCFDKGLREVGFWALRLAASLGDVGAGSYLAGLPHIASRARQPQGPETALMVC